MALSEADRTRLERILGMLGSDHAGERAAAGLKATQALKAAGVTWSDILHPPAAGQRRVPPPSGASPEADARLCLRHCEHLTPWEQQFIGSVARCAVFSPGQAAKVRQIADSLRSRGFA